jgi:hypothetical protein
VSVDAARTRAGGEISVSEERGVARKRNPRRSMRVAVAAAVGVVLLAGPGAPQEPAAPPRGPLFPRPFLVEHAVTHDDGRGGVVTTEPVTDVYTGSFLVSVRPDGSKLLVDLAGRQVTGVDAERGAYWAVSFDRLRQLRERAVELERLDVEPVPREVASSRAGAAATAPPGAGDAAAAGAEARADEAPELVVEELPLRLAAASGAGDGSGMERAAASVLARPGVRRLRVSPRATGAEDGRDASFEAWVDPGVTLSPRALAALAAFERDVLGGTPGGPSARLDAARRFAGGALPVRTRRSLEADGAEGGAGGGAVPAPILDDAAIRVEWLDAPPDGLLEVPAGLVRVPHPLELVVAAGERDRALLRGQLP